MISKVRHASTIQFRDLINKNIKIGKFSRPPRPFYYLNPLKPSIKSQELCRKEWKDLSVEEIKDIYFEYFVKSFCGYNKNGRKDFIQSYKMVCIIFFIFSPLLCIFNDYLLRLYYYYFLYEQFDRFFSDHYLRYNLTVDYLNKKSYGTVPTPYSEKYKPLAYTYYYKFIYSENSMFNPFYWFLQDRKNKKLQSLKDDPKNALINIHEY